MPEHEQPEPHDPVADPEYPRITAYDPAADPEWPEAWGSEPTECTPAATEPAEEAQA